MWLFGRKAKALPPPDGSKAKADAPQTLQGPHLIRRIEITVEREWTSTVRRAAEPAAAAESATERSQGDERDWRESRDRSGSAGDRVTGGIDNETDDRADTGNTSVGHAGLAPRLRELGAVWRAGVGVGDVNGDGVNDIVLMSPDNSALYPGNPARQSITIFLNTLYSQDQIPALITAPGNHSIAASYAPATGSIYAPVTTQPTVVTVPNPGIATFSPCDFCALCVRLFECYGVAA